MLGFPTRAASSLKPGYPVRAHPCECDRPMVVHGEDTCLRCGKHPAAIVADTWQDRAQLLSGRRTQPDRP